MNGLCNVTVGRLGRALGARKVVWSLVILERNSSNGTIWKAGGKRSKARYFPRRNERERPAEWTADWWR